MVIRGDDERRLTLGDVDCGILGLCSSVVLMLRYISLKLTLKSLEKSERLFSCFGFVRMVIALPLVNKSWLIQ